MRTWCRIEMASSVLGYHSSWEYTAQVAIYTGSCPMSHVVFTDLEVSGFSVGVDWVGLMGLLQ